MNKYVHIYIYIYIYIFIGDRPARGAHPRAARQEGARVVESERNNILNRYIHIHVCNICIYIYIYIYMYNIEHNIT